VSHSRSANATDRDLDRPSDEYARRVLGIRCSVPGVVNTPPRREAERRVVRNRRDAEV